MSKPLDFTQFEPGAIISISDGCRERLYKLAGIHLGGVGAESVYTMFAIDMSKPSETNIDGLMVVPTVLLEGGH